MTDTPMRAWCAIMQWPGRKQFRFGTVFVRANGPMHEIESELHREFTARIGSILPIGTPLPAIINMVPGMIVFTPERPDE